MMEDKLHTCCIGSAIWEESKEKPEKVEVESDWRILDKGRKYFASDWLFGGSSAEPDVRPCPPTSHLLRPPANTWGLPAPVGTAFPCLAPRRDSRKCEKRYARLDLVLKHSDATIATYV
jgi:hypothetical protein